MKNLKLMSILFSLITVVIVTVFMSSCKKDTAKVNNDLNDNSELLIQSKVEENLYMEELVNSTSSEKVKKWLTMDPEKETDPELALKLFTSLTIEESREVNEIITKLENRIFENYTVEELNLSYAEQLDAKQEIAQSSEKRRILNENAISTFQKSMWSLNKEELIGLKKNMNTELKSRSNCSNRARVFPNNSAMTVSKPYFTNCKASYDVKTCKSQGPTGNYHGCNDDDCDWEFRFEGWNTKHRVVYNWSLYQKPLAIAIDVGIRLEFGNKLNVRYQFWGGQWHSYLQIGYPDFAGSGNALTTVSRWTLRTFLSMH